MYGSTLTFAAHPEESAFIIPTFTYSPNQKYGIAIPVFHLDDDGPDKRKNKIVELGTGRTVAVIDAETGYDRPLNFRVVAPPRWSSDSSVLLWKVQGKWSPNALVLTKFEDTKADWQLNLLKTGQEAILSHTLNAAPKQYAIAKESNAGSGAAYPDGFTIDVYTHDFDSTSFSLPLKVHVDLSSNPNQAPNKPMLDAYVDAIVTEDGKFIVKQFHLGLRNHW